ncbi:MAG: 2-oxoacid:acceptor oxidoreductase family protein, partial [Pseudomonadota bacterium]
MITRTTFSGFGGQGVLLMGYVLSHGAMHKGLNVTYFPSYGAEMRGGTANCTVTLSDKKIASPVASNPDILVAMNFPSLAKFEASVVEGGTVFLNASLF